MKMVYFTGTHRCRTPAATLETLTPLLGDFGITRVADVTGLDVLGVPVAQAARPLAATLTVSQGKGATRAAAKVSAVMEAIELRHAESAVPPPVATGPAAMLKLDYDVTDLEPRPGALITANTVLEWIPARGALTGYPTMVPRDLVRMGRRSRADWGTHMLRASTNGLASGNTRAEAIAHALLELIERDAGAALGEVPAAQRHCLDLDTVTDQWCAELITRIRGAGAWLEIAVAPTRFGVPCFACYLWVEDAAGSISGGAGAHSDPAVALSRAITEAAQSRLTAIAGGRDDISPGAYQDAGVPGTPPARAGQAVSWTEVTGLGWDGRSDEEEAARAARRIADVTGAEPLIVDLAGQPEFAVVKALSAGLAFQHGIPRPAAEAA